MLSPISSYNHNKYCYKQDIVSFHSSNRKVCSAENENKILYRNSTRLFRDDICWNMLVKYITKNEKAKKIYCYACSDGSEPYSLALALISKLGYKNAEKFFPIIAKDKDNYIIDKANSGFINITQEDKLRLAALTKIHVKEFMEMSNSPSLNDAYSVYKVHDKLRKCVDFSTGDLVTDSKSLNFDNAVLMFRNVWPYLDEAAQRQLIRNLSKNFNNTSSLVIGGFDCSIDNFLRASYGKGEVTTLDERLNYGGLYLVKPLIYEKRNIKNPINFINTLHAHLIQYVQLIMNKLKPKIRY